VQAALGVRQDTRGEAFRMTIGARRATTRPEAARLIQEWTASAARPGLPYGRSQQPLGELGGMTIDGADRRAGRRRTT
jgi:hypothetical protein